MTDNQRPKILIVDDKAENLFALEKLLRKLNAIIIQANSGFEALELTLEHDFCVAIIDVQMPEIDGYELATLLRGNQSTSSLPIIFVSAIYSDEYHHRKGYEAGAVDFLSKPFVPEILLSKVRVFIRLHNQRRKLQTLVEQLNQANGVLSRHTLQLETSYQVSHRATQILALPTLMEEVVRLIRAEFDYATVSIWLRQADADAVTLKALSRKTGDNHVKLGATIPCKEGQDIIAHVCRTKEAQMRSNIHLDEIHTQIMDKKGIHSELVLPLRAGEKLLGVLDIQSDKKAAFDVRDRKVLQTMADQIAIAVRNARLYAKITRFNEVLENKVQERTAELETAYQRLEMLDRNKTEFMQVVSHELRTPLSLIMGFSQMLMYDSRIEKDDIYNRQVSGIVKGAERMRDIVNSMLDMVRIDNEALKLDMAKVSLCRLMARLRTELQETLLQRDLTLTLENLDALPEIKANGETITKMFHHLLINAIKFTPDGGAITVAGRVRNHAGTDKEGFVEITVSDTGIGVDPHVHDLIFTKFYQTGEVNFHSTGKTKFKGGGPGLGLAIAKGIVKAHGGHIWVVSPGEDEAECPGSSFHIVLPIEQEEAMREIISAPGSLANNISDVSQSGNRM
jgi:signal transduction histidine kinase/DNA-binding response OmpR family regulator